MSSKVLASLTIVIPAIELSRLEAFMRELDAAGVPYQAKMDSHPSEAELAALPSWLLLVFRPVP